MHAALRDRGWIMKHMKVNRLMRDQAMHLPRQRRLVAANDNLLVWHGWKLDHRHRAGAQNDYVRLLYEHGIIQDVFDWIVFIDGVDNIEQHGCAGTLGRLNDQGARGFTNGESAPGSYFVDVLRTNRLRGLSHVATRIFDAPIPPRPAKPPRQISLQFGFRHPIYPCPR